MKNEEEDKEDKNLKEIFLKMCEDFEKKHAKIINISSYIKETDDDVIVFTKPTLKDAYEHISYLKRNGLGTIVPNKFILGWTECNDNIRKYDNIGVYPKSLLCPRNIFNMWKPFAMELKQNQPYIPNIDGMNILLNHIRILCDNNDEVYDYFIKWIAQMIQYPEIKTVVITLISKEGAGKGTLIKLLTLLFGGNKVLESSNKVLES